MFDSIKKFFIRLLCIHDFKHTDDFVLEGTDKVVVKLYVCSKCDKHNLWRWRGI